MQYIKKVILSAAVLTVVFLFFVGAAFAEGEATGVVTADVLNFRDGPGTYYQVIGQIYRNEQVVILGSQDGWYNVSYAGMTGWVSGDYVVVNQTNVAAQEPVTVQEPAKVYGTINGDYVNVRSGPGLNYNVITMMNWGDRVEVLGNTEEWYNILLSDGSKGWVYGNYIVVNQTNVAAQEPAKVYGTISANSVNIRSGPGLNYNVITMMNWGDRVEILGNTEEWYNILLSDGSEGWVFHELISVGDVSRAYDTASMVVEYAKKFLGVRYQWGGNTPEQGFDCSGFVKYVLSQYGIELNRVAADQALQGVAVEKGNLRIGDLIFFDTNGGYDYINHVGLYIGNNQFIHASSSAGKVVISDFSGFYSNAFMAARRVIR